jgi:hypothetical protein
MRVNELSVIDLLKDHVFVLLNTNKNLGVTFVQDGG